MRIGFGYDIHRFREGRALVLGGVHIPHTRGLDGHSDADCLTHAIADAILGSMALRDIGHYFPNTDPACKNMDSQDILKRAVAEALKKGYRVGNLDCCIIAEEPKISPHLSAMKAKLSSSMNVTPDDVGIKATTNEKIGDLGKALGIAAHAVVLMVRI